MASGLANGIIPASPFAAESGAQASDEVQRGSSQQARADGAETLQAEPRQSGELKSFGAGAAAAENMKKASSTGSDAMRRFSSAGSSVLLQLAVVSKFQELVRLAQEAYIDPADLSRVKDLGEGAFAKVVHCRLDSHDGTFQDVAVKLLKPSLFGSQLDVQDFIREGVVLKRMRHPSVVRVVGLGFKSADGGRGATTDSLFIAQELCEGGALRDVVAMQMFRPLQVLYTYRDALRWCQQIAAGVAHLHDRSPLIIHRDLKLDNVLLCGDPLKWDAKIADFGLHATVDATQQLDAVKSLKEKVQKPSEEDEERLKNESFTQQLNENMKHMSTSRAGPTSLARTATFKSQSTFKSQPSFNHTSTTSTAVPEKSMRKRDRMRSMLTMRRHRKPPVKHDLTGQTGSYLNMAPEVVKGEPYNEAADIFGLGIVIYELFTKTVTAASVIVTGAPNECSDYAWKVAQGYRRPTPYGWPDDLVEVVKGSWDQDPDSRLTAKEVVASLQRLEASGAVDQMDQAEAAALERLNQKGGCGCF
mmetsp:Transcript_21115/g.63531  ORF Transcript_21115/g.63531 Transcript_21115/m.63531 type:complete len:531 (+) Transcript_21115:485-2077(+)|eukprot:CAMPEP_0206141324 /NCGR_PEP_ID=MMETSP1473-20131121/12545_1 /ASSEMBLY_ACC=CAM_ASM_001109 /TAXON_ID=1461547 /ORGANISM="Stichococcus sp, Strain RCC1054" /LENGTH=530 /DNA_ID=CAMNT_0053535843 /DNA_START=410 /DNA_END=2002 /DNA_ORIENTATION=+